MVGDPAAREHTGPDGWPVRVARTTLHGTKLAATGRRAVLLAFIDDHSRLLVGWRWVTGEDVRHP